MIKHLKAFCIFLFLGVIMFSFVRADTINSYTLTKEKARIKTVHDNGFKQEMQLDDNDLHYGWGLGEFYIQGYSDMTLGEDGIPVFLMKNGDQIYLGFNLQQNLDQLNGNSNHKISNDTNGYDDEFEVKGYTFGKGCLIIQKTSNDGHTDNIIRTDYLSTVAANKTNALLGPLEEGSYKAALDYEIQYPVTLNTWYNDYKIPFSFKIQNNDDYYTTLATVAGVNPTYISTGAIIIVTVGLILFFIIFIIIKNRQSASGDPPDSRDGSENNIIVDDSKTEGSIYLTRTSQLHSSDPSVNTALKRQPIRISPAKLKIICALMLVLVLSITTLYPVLSNPSTYPTTTQYLDKCLSTVNTLMLGTGAASFIISIFPDDIGTSIANELAQACSLMMLVIVVILLEKILLTTIGLTASLIIFPVGCLIGILSVYYSKKEWAQFAIKVFIFGLCISLIMPLACLMGRTIEAMNPKPMERALANASEASEYVNKLPDKEEDKSVIQRVLSGIIEGIKSKIEWAKGYLSDCMTSLAIHLVSFVGIPILIIFAFIWVIRFLIKRDYSGFVIGVSKRFITRSSGRITNITKNVSGRIKKK